MDRVLNEMRRYYSRRSDPPPIRGAVFSEWVDTLAKYHEDTQAEIAALKAEVEALKAKKGRAA